jgi:hypothetical protein
MTIRPAPAESSPSSPPHKGGRRGALQAPQTATEAGLVSRVVRVPLERPDDAAWLDLVALAREGAAFANGLIASWWAEAHGWQPREGQSSFKDFKGRLSGDVRVAIQGEAMGIWRRLKARIMRRDQRLPAFAADRSLVIRGQYAGGKGGIRLEPDGAGYVLRLLIVGKDIGPWMTFPVWALALKKDRYLSSLLIKIAAGHYRCSKVTLQIDQRRRKLFALCAYDRPVPSARDGSSATLGPLEEDGSLLLRTAGATRDWTREIYEIRTKKDQYEGIIRRFRRTVGRGPGWRQIYRRNLPPTYEAWARGKLHQVSAAMIAWLLANGANQLTIRPLNDGDWPAHLLETMLTYKGQQSGITVTKDSGEDDTTDAGIRADAGPLRKEQKKVARVKQIARLVKEDLDQ